MAEPARKKRPRNGDDVLPPPTILHFPNEPPASTGPPSLQQLRRELLASSQLLAEFHTLSRREQTVLLLFVRHCTPKRVAGELGTSVKTVRNQLDAIRLKLLIPSLTRLAQCFALAIALDPNIPPADRQNTYGKSPPPP